MDVPYALPYKNIQIFKIKNMKNSYTILLKDVDFHLFLKRQWLFCRPRQNKQKMVNGYFADTDY